MKDNRYDMNEVSSVQQMGRSRDRAFKRSSRSRYHESRHLIEANTFIKSTDGATLLIISTDNALGSARGDIDDGLALLYLLQQDLSSRQEEIALIAGTHGNTSAEQATQNCSILVHMLKLKIDICQGARLPGDSAPELIKYFEKIYAPDAKFRMIELGPLTGLSILVRDKHLSARRVSEIAIVGTTLKTWGRMPPLWPFEFNLTKDLEATRIVFRSGLPLTILPLDIAKRFRLTQDEIKPQDSDTQAWLFRLCTRWFRRNLLFYLRRSVIVWDAVLAIYLVHPEYFRRERKFVRLTDCGQVVYCDSGIPVNVITDFDLERCKTEFCRVISQTVLNR